MLFRRSPTLMLAALALAQVVCQGFCKPSAQCNDIASNIKDAILMAKASLDVGLGGSSGGSCNRTGHIPAVDCKDGKVCLVPCCVRPGTCCCICSPRDDCVTSGDSTKSRDSKGPQQLNVYPLPAYASLDPAPSDERPPSQRPQPYPPQYQYIPYPYPYPVYPIQRPPGSLLNLDLNAQIGGGRLL